MDIRRSEPVFFSPYPVLVREFSFLSDARVPFGVLKDALINADYAPLAQLVEFDLFDVYPDPLRKDKGDGAESIPFGMTSYLVGMKWEPLISTLSADHIGQVIDSVIKSSLSVGFELRCQKL